MLNKYLLHPLIWNEQKAQRKEEALYSEENKKNQFAWNTRPVQICHREQKVNKPVLWCSEQVLVASERLNE